MFSCGNPSETSDAVPPPGEPGMTLSYRYLLKPTAAQERALHLALDEQRRLYNRLLQDIKEGWASYVRLRDAAANTGDPVLAMRAASCRSAYRSETSYVGMCHTLTLMREAYPDRYGALPAHMERWTVGKLADAQAAFLRRAMKGDGAKAGPPRYKPESRWDSFGFRQFMGIQLVADREEVEDVRRQRRDARQAAKAGEAFQTVGLPDGVPPVAEVQGPPTRRRSKRGEMFLGWGGMPGALRVRMHRPLPAGADLRSAVFTRDGDRWFACLQVEVATATLRAERAARDAGLPPERRVVASREPVGIDWGVLKLLTLSDGTVFENPRLFRRVRHRIVELSQALARCKRSSKRRAKVKRDLRACYARLRDMRLTHAHQTSAHIVARHLLIAVEDLAIKNMTRSARGTIDKPGTNVRRKAGLNREVIDTIPATRNRLLTYKAERAGGEVRKVDPAGTSQECSRCHERAPKGLGERTHMCGHCGLAMDRDLNAARNIRDRAFPPEPGVKAEVKQAA